MMAMWYLIYCYMVTMVTTAVLDYCIIGAGPGGIQLSYYLQKYNFNYVVLERNSIPGSFFEVYPRRRTLISINKRNTGQTNTEFNMRHDWNSLLSDDPNMVFKHYSKEMFPPADALLSYLHDYTTRFHLHIHYNTNVEQVLQDSADLTFTLSTSNNTIYSCKHLIASTGISKLLEIKAAGAEYVEGYDTVSHNKEDYENLRVLILGKGNSGFETADLIYGNTAMVHLLSRTRVKLAWETHYVGDLRGYNNEILDTYQLKSMDALIESKKLDGVKMVTIKKDGSLWQSDDVNEYGPYDKIINCMGFNFDPGPFKNMTGEEDAKYPDMGWDFQSNTVPNLYYAGTITHELDKRISSGGFIHGFRYSSRALAHLLAARNHGNRWPSTGVPLHSATSLMLRRFLEMSGPYQMFYVLVDVYLRQGNHVELFKEVPIGMLHTFHELILEPRTKPLDMVVTILEYGADYSKAGGDPFRETRTETDPYLAHTCNFIHPVLYHYTSPPPSMPKRTKRLRGYNRKFHLPEDLHNDWGTLENHRHPLQYFLGTVWKADLTYRTPEHCSLKLLTRSEMPVLCRKAPILTQVAETTLRISPNLIRSQMTYKQLLRHNQPATGSGSATTSNISCH